MSSLGKLRQKDQLKFKASLGLYRVLSQSNLQIEIVLVSNLKNILRILS